MGTLVDGDLLIDEQVSHIVSIRETPLANGDSESRFGICILDCSTSNFDLSAFIDDVCRTRLETALRQARVKELVFKKVRQAPMSTIA
jgi:DNA mismatch repair protein MSH6